MKTYKPGDVAIAIGVSVSSIRNWSDQPEIQEFLSDLARREGAHINAKQREYTQQDLYVLNTIARRKTRYNTWEDVADFLRDGNLETELPASASLVQPVTAAENFADAIMLRQQIDMLTKSLADAEEEIHYLRNKLDDVREEEQSKAQDREKAIRDEFQEREERLRQEIINLNRQMARLEIRMEMMQEKEDDEE
jgi:DNA-binding transcriptional MerR regulator